ncbi:MAG: hypothetical protein R8J84_08640 [Mariprofundales bacterium]
MRVAEAAAAGASCGALAGFAICMVIGVGFYDTLMRMSVLGAAGGWIGMMLILLDQALPSPPRSSVETDEDGADDASAGQA